MRNPHAVMSKIAASPILIAFSLFTVLLGAAGCVTPTFIESAADPVVMSTYQPNIKAWFRCEGSDSGAMYAQMYIWNNSDKTVRVALDNLSIRSSHEENMRPSSVGYVLKNATGSQQSSADLKPVDLKPNDSIDIEMRRSLSKMVSTHSLSEPYAIIVPMRRQIAANDTPSEDGPSEAGAQKKTTEDFEGAFRCVVSY
jgi:hypothetical protein